MHEWMNLTTNHLLSGPRSKMDLNSVVRYKMCTVPIPQRHDYMKVLYVSVKRVVCFRKFYNRHSIY
jgi:hypothetical protein